MALTLAQLRSLTRDIVGDTQGDTFTDALVNSAINYAIKNYATKLENTYVESNVTPDASGFCTLPTDYIRVKRILYTVAGTTVTELLESSFQFESMKSNVWQTATGVPKRWVMWSGEKAKLTPIPSPIYTAIVGYIETPTALALDADTVDARIPEVHNEYLKFAAASWLLLLDGDTFDPAKADNFMQRFNQMIGYSDPVLELKMSQSRTQAAREM